nr:DUF418 domain-containing protein [uncultured Sphingorhabdus sp.]
MPESQSRYITLDAMRGVAVMGILAMNIIGFSMPEWAYITPAAYGGETFADRVAWLFSFVFVDGKMRGLFSLLFGASMMLIIERATEKGENPARVHYLRMIWLALFGLLHYFFIWFGDILFLYAVVGMIAFLFRDWAAERLVKSALWIFAAGLVFWGLQFGGLQVIQYLGTQPDAATGWAQQYREIRASPEFDYDIAGQIALHRGVYWEIVSAKFANWGEPFGTVLMSIGETLPLMMVGMAMHKSGFITRGWAQSDYRRWVWQLVPWGVLLTGMLALWMMQMQYDPITSLAVFFLWGAIPRLMLTIGYAALLILLINRFEGHVMVTRLAAAGRAAFSNYLGTSIVMTTLFYGYGIGLYGEVSRSGLWLFVIGAWVVMLSWPKPWLMRFHYGPLEWLWRSLARGKVQAFRR